MFIIYSCEPHEVSIMNIDIRTADLHYHLIYSVLINYNCLYTSIIMFLDVVPSLTCLKICNVN